MARLAWGEKKSSTHPPTRRRHCLISQAASKSNPWSRQLTEQCPYPPIILWFHYQPTPTASVYDPVPNPGRLMATTAFEVVNGHCSDNSDHDWPMLIQPTHRNPSKGCEEFDFVRGKWITTKHEIGSWISILAGKHFKAYSAGKHVIWTYVLELVGNW